MSKEFQFNPSIELEMVESYYKRKLYLDRLYGYDDVCKRKAQSSKMESKITEVEKRVVTLEIIVQNAIENAETYCANAPDKQRMHNNSHKQTIKSIKLDSAKSYNTKIDLHDLKYPILPKDYSRPKNNGDTILSQFNLQCFEQLESPRNVAHLKVCSWIRDNLI